MRRFWASSLQIFSGAGGIARAAIVSGQKEPGGAVVLSPGNLPTTDLYLKGRFDQHFGGSVCYVDTLRSNPNSLDVDAGALVVIVRHVPGNWRRWLKRHRDQFAGIAYLMDDDMPAALRAHELPWGYALKTTWRFACTWQSLKGIFSEIWFSTPELMRRYPMPSARLTEPEYVAAKREGATPLVYFYHGSWAHRREIKWLVPIVRQVQQAAPGTWFEIMGTDQVRKLFRGIPRVRVIHPMPWKDYLAYAGTVRYHVGLAPCFDTHFNRARSHSKIFDITRLGAAGIYSDVTPYADRVVHGSTGLLCANVLDKWVAATIHLLCEKKLQTSIHAKAAAWCTNQGRLGMPN